MPDPDAENATCEPRRRRASKACLTCRARKVRCDAVLRRGQCTNCALDGRRCEVRGRPTKYRSLKGQSKSPSQGQEHEKKQHHNRLNTTGNEALDQRRSSASSLRAADSSTAAGGIRAWIPLAPVRHDEAGRNPASQTPCITSPSGSDHADRSTGSVSAGVQMSASSDARVDSPMTSHVIYSYFQFLKVDLSLMSEQDVHFLDSQGCFKVPARQAADQFVREYFLLVHPGLPLLDEASFWEMYSPGERSPPDKPRLSLFVFQAILFASCSFLSPATIRSLGFESVRSARATYYRRAKLLFDFCGEPDHRANAQGALLLSYNASMRDRKKANSLWLTTAIQLAEDIGARHVWTNHTGHTPAEANALKRLWWCCIIRDRILPLGVRRRLHIDSDSFDGKSNALTEDDFAEEIANSRVYDPDTKRSLIRLFITLCDLAAPLADVITTIYPSSRPLNHGIHSNLARIESCKQGLQSWYERAVIKFPTPAGIVSTSGSLILFTNLVYMYYHSARLALYQHEALLYATQLSGLIFEENKLLQSRLQLEDAAGEITDNLKELIHLRLSRYLPISVVAFAAVPLALHILDVKLSATPSQTAQRQGQLNIYIQAMEVFKTQYDGTDEVWGFISEVLDSIMNIRLSNDLTWNKNSLTPTTTTDGRSSSDAAPVRGLASPPSRSDWGTMLLRKPTLYFRLTHTIDLSLSMGRYPDESDFSVLLSPMRLSMSMSPAFFVGMMPGQEPLPSQVEDADGTAYQEAVSSNLNDKGNAYDTVNGTTDLEFPLSLDFFDIDFAVGDGDIFAGCVSTPT